MARKKWAARILWWRGKNPKPRKNQTVSSRLIKAKTIEELAKKIARARKRSWQLIESGGRQDPGSYFTRLLEKKITELSKTEKEILIEKILGTFPLKTDNDKSILTIALAKLSVEELKLLLEHVRVLFHDLQSTESAIS